MVNILLVMIPRLTEDALMNEEIKEEDKIRVIKFLCGAVFYEENLNNSGMFKSRAVSV